MTKGRFLALHIRPVGVINLDTNRGRGVGAVLQVIGYLYLIGIRCKVIFVPCGTHGCHLQQVHTYENFVLLKGICSRNTHVLWKGLFQVV